MPHKFKLEKPPIGHAAESVAAGETRARVVYREFLSSEDGMRLIHRLEGFPSDFLARLPEHARVNASSVDHLLVHVDSTGEAVAYVNELRMVATARLARPVNAGDPIYDDDVFDIAELQCGEIEVPTTHGVLVVLSKGWRKGLYFDFGPLHPALGPRSYSLWETLGQCYGYLAFQELHSITDEEWAKLFADKWFPFLGMGGARIRELLGWIRSGKSTDSVVSGVASDLLARLPNLRARWAASTALQQHSKVLLAALDRFEAHDWISVNSILYPRIEGVLRVAVERAGITPVTQDTMSASPAAVGIYSPVSRALPLRFQRYLREVYFASFDPRIQSDVARNSVSHGVASQSSFNQKAGVIAVLIVEQLFHHLPEQAGK